MYTQCLRIYLVIFIDMIIHNIKIGQVRFISMYPSSSMTSVCFCCPFLWSTICSRHLTIRA